MGMIVALDTPPCPANGLERAAWHRSQAQYHTIGGWLWCRYMATALCIEMRFQRDNREPTLPLTNPIDALVYATILRQAAADEDAPDARNEMLGWARHLESLAMGEHVTAPKQ
ncbi:hypothetical protein TSH7_25020 [Azospirillum sp. TSH7]|uniref:hypothetical protein n=1 Tax=unclassified Azospirillum TaxID=2630922 RepID=UPI000D60F477|nr:MULTISPECIES: hypothetical protein [unclassified Azospirillum]PWC57813.1 hypothetical protein TSH7_25020 [Azospirillum sp. TSH7]PWC70232.1 hypothetical protein TSH20_07060 [Azospirillum sp. TSH20]